VKRYVNGLKNVAVPNRDGEGYDGVGLDAKGNNSYNGRNNCRNPLFAQNLPTAGTEELCKLSPGPRDPSLVFFAAITGVPWQLLTEDPTNEQSKFVASLTKDRWKQIVGNDPENYDYSGMDPHMIQSQQPRAGLPGASSADTTDPYHGREWDTGNGDLQYACTFQLPSPKNCTEAKYAGACDCTSTTGSRPPLCDSAGTTQVRGKAYPGVRQLTVARDMADQGIVASLCPRSLDATNNNPNYGYRPAVKVIVDRLKNALASQCLPQELTANTCGDVPCLILETLPNPGPETDCAVHGLAVPDPIVLAKFREQQRADQGSVTGDAGAGFVDQTKLPVCQVTQLVNQAANKDPSCGAQATASHFSYQSDFDSTGSCASSSGAGWCYVQGGGAGGSCPQSILFSTGGNPLVGAKISLQCIEASSAGTDAGH
jgi:hypothetical protein